MESLADRYRKEAASRKAGYTLGEFGSLIHDWEEGLIPVSRVKSLWDQSLKERRTRMGPTPRLKPLLDDHGRLKGFEFESPVELQARRIDELYENLLFQNLVSAFDDIPMRRVFPVCFYTPETWTDHKFETALQEVIKATDCDIVQEYAFLQGSGLYRGSLQRRKRQTRSQFERSHQQLVEHLVQTLKESNVTVIGNLTVNVSPAAHVESKGESDDWTGKLKDFTEALKNLLLIGASAVFLFDGTLMKSSAAEPKKQHEVSIISLDRNAELQALPKFSTPPNLRTFARQSIL